MLPPRNLPAIQALMTGCAMLGIYIIGGMSRIGYDADARLQWHGWRRVSRVRNPQRLIT